MLHGCRYKWRVGRASEPGLPTDSGYGKASPLVFRVPDPRSDGGSPHLERVSQRSCSMSEAEDSGNLSDSMARTSCVPYPGDVITVLTYDRGAQPCYRSRGKSSRVASVCLGRRRIRSFHLASWEAGRCNHVHSSGYFVLHHCSVQQWRPWSNQFDVYRNYHPLQALDLISVWCMVLMCENPGANTYALACACVSNTVVCSLSKMFKFGRGGAMEK